jgi:pyruvate/2-oxoglutarate dehydrogenase complex dihydrolipoamide dehydrogenase (E3) component
VNCSNNDQEAQQAGIAYRLAELPVAAILRTRTTGEGGGRLKALVGADDHILDFTALEPRAGELLQAVQLAMAHGLPFTAVRDLVIAHPTYAEGLVTLFGTVPAYFLAFPSGPIRAR